MSPARHHMSESRGKSLASYFDEPGDVVGASHNWYEQAESGLGLPDDRQEGSIDGRFRHDIPDLSEDDEWEDGHDALHADSLGSWLWHPKSQKPVWVPSDHIYSVFDKPAKAVFQEKGDTTWKANAWGKDDYERRHDMAMGKSKHQKETKEDRKARMDRMNGMKKLAYQKAYDIAIHPVDASQNSAVLPAEVIPILRNIEARRQATVGRKNEELARIRSGKATGKERNQELHALTVNTLKDAGSVKIADRLRILDGVCKTHGFHNVVGTDMPPLESDGSCFVFVALDFLSKVKKMILKLALAHARRQIAGTATISHSTELYDFVNYSYQGNDIRNRLSRNGYPKPVPKGLADSEAMIAWTTHVRELERKAYTEMHPDKKMPKRMQDPRRKGRGKKGKTGKGKKKSRKNEDLLDKIVKAVLHHKTKGGHGKKGKHPAHHKSHDFHKGQEGDPGEWEHNADTRTVRPPPPRPRPVGPPPRRIDPSRPVPATAQQMQRGYF